MQQDFVRVDDAEMLEGAFAKLNECQCHTLPVMRDGELVGLVTMDNMGEYMRIQAARRQ